MWKIRLNLGTLSYIFVFILLTSNCLEKAKVIGYVKFTNVKCDAFDPSFANFSVCQLNVPQRGLITLNIYVKLYQLPVNNCTVNLSLLKKTNTYHPFLYNYTVNFCKFMAKRPGLSFMRIFFDMLLEDSNINHSCPYNHDIIVKDMVFHDDYLRLLPLPTGDYMFNLRVAAYNDWKADVKAYIYAEL